MPSRPDHIRGMTSVADASLGGVVVRDIELPPEARLYSYTFSVRSFAPDNGAPLPDVLATLQLQDSTLEIPSYGCAIAEIRADLPGVAWPAFARLIAPAFSKAVLHLTYGHCAP